jgi:hypothetical protein
VTSIIDIHVTQNKPYTYLGIKFITLLNDVDFWNIPRMLGVQFEFESLGAVFKGLHYYITRVYTTRVEN